MAGVLVCQWVFAVIGAGWPAPRWYYWCDAWIFVGSMVATYAMARGWNDFWLAWIAVDLVGVPAAVALPATTRPAILYVVYGGLVIWGFVVWLRRQPRRDRRRRELERGAGMSATSSVRLDTVERAVADIAAGKAVVVVDDEDRENEGDLIFAASKATPELMAFTIRHSSGVICVPMPADDARPARDPADDAAQQGPDAHGVHDLGRRPRRRHHRHLAPPTAPTPPGCWPTRRPSRGRSPGPATSSRCATARAACWSAAATPRPRSTWPGWPG